jgi:Mn-containing catalase
MYLRIDQIPVDFPTPKSPSPNGAAALQELLGGKFGEMSTLMNYTFQSLNFRGRAAARPYYDLIANIAAEELSHIETVTYAINLLLTGSTPRGTDPTKHPLAKVEDARLSYHFLSSGQAALPVDSMGNYWTGQYVTNSGNLKFDLIHNFFLECGARANKMRVYEMVDDPVARAATGYLLVRGGTHIVAYARALEHLTGADLSKLFPIPDLSNDKFPEARKLEEKGYANIMFRFSPGDYGRLAELWNGPHPENGRPLTVSEGLPEGFAPPELPEEPQLTSPGIDPEFLAAAAKRILG